MEQLLSIPSGFKVFGLEIKFYGITMALAYAVALIVCIALCKKKKYDENLPYKLLLIAFPLAVIGGRLGYVIFDNRTWTFAEILDIRSGGLMLYGGVLLALVGMLIYAWVKKINPLKLFDLIAPCLVLAQAIGRWGNFFNQEAYGNLITNSSMQWFPFGVYIESGHFTNEALEQVVSAYGSGVSGAWFYATFFYESLCCVLTFITLYLVYKKTNKVGLTTALYLVLYATERLLVEGIRTDSLYLGSTGIRISQLISIIMMICGGAYLFYLLLMHLKNKKTMIGEKQPGLYDETSNNLKQMQYQDAKLDENNNQTSAQQNPLLKSSFDTPKQEIKNERVEKIKNRNKKQD